LYDFKNVLKVDFNIPANIETYRSMENRILHYFHGGRQWPCFNPNNIDLYNTLVFMCENLGEHFEVYKGYDIFYEHEFVETSDKCSITIHATFSRSHCIIL
jgi:hypothetical protein